MVGPFAFTDRLKCPGCGGNWGRLARVAEGVSCSCGRSYNIRIACDGGGNAPAGHVLAVGSDVRPVWIPGEPAWTPSHFYLVQRGGPP